jgi:hypothetical protein
MKTKPHKNNFTSKKSARLGAYLAAGVGASTTAVPTLDAAIIGINIAPISGVNGGASSGGYTNISAFPGGGGKLYAYNGYAGYWGLRGTDGPSIAFTSGTRTSPVKFAANASIDNTLTFSPNNQGEQWSTFRKTVSPVSVSPDFGPGSYIGIKTQNGNFGWLEVTWTSATNQFQVFSGAYQSVPGVAILAGDTGTAAVPEPSTWAMSALLAGGVGATLWRRRRAAAQAKADAEPQAA